MSRLRFINGTVLTPAGSSGSLDVADGIIVEAADRAEIVDLDGGYLLPGFIDTQVNGGGGVLFNDSPDVATIARIGDAHRQFGTTSFLPTLISDDLDVIDRAMRATEEAFALGVPGVIGIHIEGPFIAAARKGTHDETKFRRLTPQSIALLTSLKRGRTLVTLAPETCEAEDIRALAGAGVIVAAGHTDADYATMRGAFAAGVTGVTHLFNAMSPLAHRAPGVVGAVLEDRHAYAGLIVDGRHVDPAVLRIALNARPRDRFMLVTDAMPTVGSGSATFRLQGKTIRVENDVCVDEAGVLSGSNLDMAGAVRNAVRMIGVTVAEASVMSSSAPAAFLRLGDRGTLAIGRRADLVWIDRDLQVRGVWIARDSQAPNQA
jgi:N-acetylglucosamine-6-phosphate deacetylase